MRYRLTVLTHGADDTLTRALASFVEHVTPAPTEAFIYADGHEASGRAFRAARRHDGWPWVVDGSDEPTGFCEATRVCWQEAAVDHAGVDWVFHLEHDFVFARAVDLAELAGAMTDHPYLAQIALQRNAVNWEEKAAGGLVAAHPDWYQQVEEWEEHGAAPTGERSWLQHDVYWTTNPSLFPRSIPATHRWPDGPECEGKLKFQLAEERPGTRFALWGRRRDEPWVEHVGERTGWGY